MFGFGRKKLDLNSAVALLMTSFFWDKAIIIDSEDLILRTKDFSPSHKGRELTDKEKNNFIKHHVHIKYQFLCGALAKSQDMFIYMDVKELIRKEIHNQRNIFLDESDCSAYNKAYASKHDIHETVNLFCINVGFEDTYQLGIDLFTRNFVKHFKDLNGAMKAIKII
tara:strand:+ start:8 stop:508 length:501 start_codon:yes stop_codon:yes gene_type:complete